MNVSARNLAMCRLRERFTVEILQSGCRVAVQGDSTVWTLDGNLPEGDGEFPPSPRPGCGATGAATRTPP
jgi:hypothetical protein